MPINRTKHKAQKTMLRAPIYQSSGVPSIRLMENIAPAWHKAKK
jgi:hypothetical protein